MYSDQEFKQAVKNSNNIRQVCKRLHISPYGGNYEVVKNKIKQFNLDTSHFNKNKMIKPEKYIFELSEILVKGSYYTNITSLKNRLIKEGYFESKCANCNRSTYNINGTIIDMPLQLHHIDGDRKNNQISNLILLCPICHSLTKNYRGKNKPKEYIKCKRCNKRIRRNIYGLCRDCYVKEKNVKSSKKSSSKINCLGCGKEINYNEHRLCRVCLNKSMTNPNKPSKDILSEQIKIQSFSSLGKKYGVSGNTIKKWCVSYEIDLSYATGGIKKSLQGLKKGHEIQSKQKKLKQICPVCGKEKSVDSKICRACYIKSCMKQGN